MVNLLRRRAVPLALLIVLALSLAVNIPLRQRQLLGGDLPDYLMQAHNLVQHGRLSQAPDAAPVLGREPGYPLLLAALMRTTALGRFTPACFADESLCPRAVLRPALVVGFALMLGASALLGWAAYRLTGWAWAGVIGFGYLALNVSLWSSRHYPQSDYLALLLLAAATALLVEWGRSQHRWHAAGAGLALGALVLVKAAFLWLLPPAALALLLWRRRAPRHAALLLALAALPAVLWVMRNGVVTGQFALTDSRSGIALSTREVFNHMGLWDWLCAWVYWTRGLGDGLARALFPAAVWQPFQLDFPGGWYDLGQHRYPGLVSAAMEQHGLDEAAARARVDRDLLLAILARPLHYLTSLPVLIWRGLWVDEFILVGAPAMLWALRRGWRQGDATLLLALAPGVFSLLFYPAISLNIPRYQITAMPALALAAAWAAWRLRPWLAARLARPRAYAGRA
jgi:4-amino-4-deoxy-L-arabinose transferase-like glycosyltransferase